MHDLTFRSVEWHLPPVWPLGLPPVPDYPGRPGFKTLCPASRMSPIRDANVPDFPQDIVHIVDDTATVHELLTAACTSITVYELLIQNTAGEVNFRWVQSLELPLVLVVAIVALTVAFAATSSKLICILNMNAVAERSYKGGESVFCH